ncbi:MAG TPA: carotenoid biosynthesis protein, partial [Methylomirabilota bacterium]|nr:carotenoid biosynthesis protein [Methylomirabilota bacterium]
ADVGARRALGFAGVVWPLAWLAEFASTRWGLPFGLYHYTGATRGRELYVANVPFMDSLSFTFLAYAAFCLARWAWRGRQPSRAALAATAGGLMMLLDVVIDPVAVRGDRWFLGRIFYYAEPGAYFGVPLSNFAGWWLVGALGVGLWLRGSGWSATDGGQPAFGVGLYYAVLGFNLAVTAWLEEWLLLASGVTLHATAALAVFGRRPFRDPAWPAQLPGGGIGRGAPPPTE